MWKQRLNDVEEHDSITSSTTGDQAEKSQGWLEQLEIHEETGT